MAVESIGSSVSGLNLDALNTDTTSTSVSKSSTGKIAPETESQIIDSFMASMVTNQLQLNSQLFDFAKEAINEADSE